MNHLREFLVIGIPFFIRYRSEYRWHTLETRFTSTWLCLSLPTIPPWLGKATPSNIRMASLCNLSIVGMYPTRFSFGAPFSGAIPTGSGCQVPKATGGVFCCIDPAGRYKRRCITLVSVMTCSIRGTEAPWRLSWHLACRCNRFLRYCYFRNREN